MLASVSKVFAGAAVVALINAGYIDSLDDDICNVLPSNWATSACRNPRYPNTPVTWRMLVTHRSSLREDVPWLQKDGQYYEVGYGPIGGYFGEAAGGPCPLDDVAGFYRDFMINKPTETLVGNSQNVNWYQLGQQDGGAWQSFQPGSRQVYSNFAVGYIAALVEHASGISFANFCESYIFSPLQMDHTAWFREDLPPGTPEAMPVEFFSRNSFDDIGHYCFIDYASGSLRTSVTDMARFLNAMLSYGDDLWPRELGIDSLSCQERDSNGNAVSKCEFGVNWAVLSNAGKTSAEFYMEAFKDYDWTNGGYHDGAEAGSQTHIVVFPQAGVYAAVLTNTDGNDEYAAQEMLAEMAQTLRSLPPLSPVPQPTPVPPAPSPTPPAPTPTPPAPASFDIKITIKHDDFPEETSWSLKDAQGTVWLRQKMDTVFKWGALVEKTVAVPAGEYTFTIRDDYGDGICCQEGNGYFSVLVVCNTVLSGGSFGTQDGGTFVVDSNSVGNC